MRKYETVFISDPDLKDQARLDLFDKVRNIIAKENGILLDFDEWGNKKLAYEIKKKLRGHYVCVTYGGTGELIKELERNFRLSDEVLKFMTLLLSDNVTVEQLEKEVRETQEAQNESEQVESEQVDETDKKAVEEETVEEAASKEGEKVEETKEKTE
ncbi:MAG: 30S ribosomal protein S6 [Desulfobacula sp.]|uniref:30S ribosomal protein S6 n=1 Tax=Desulfobacula sp. TaxID=2593537 RepID=UPI0025C078A2|nr:30S ribosomal protein S6 [Desulfobacula sp.]MCD4722347.1 30S ribosomal protein S6 [Desulfobacula sp.]